MIEFFTKNLVNTSSMISVPVNTSSTKYLIDSNSLTKYISSGYSQTALMFNFSFSAATVVSHIIIKNCNFDEYYVYYNNTATNFIYFDCSNTSKDLYIPVDSVTASSIQITVGRTFPMYDEKRVGEIAILEKEFQADKNPTHSYIKTTLKKNQVVHEMPDGGVIVYNIGMGYDGKIKFTNIGTAFKDNLYSLYRDTNPFFVVENGTDTAWNGFSGLMRWKGDFNFKQTSNVDNGYYSGEVTLIKASKP